MGFGTLFFGYFLLLNVTYYSFTDLIAALVMALGLYKLSGINRPFKGAFYSSFALAAIGIFELFVQFYAMFSPGINDAQLLSFCAIPRNVIIATLTLFILLGIESVADEVGLSELAKRARFSMPCVIIIYGFCAILEVHALQTIISIKALAILSLFALIFSFATVIVNLVTVYTAYMRICMAENKDNDLADKPSRFEFINKHREHTAQKQREYAEYKIEKLNKKTSNKKKK